jgi:hypothetical protein
VREGFGGKIGGKERGNNRGRERVFEGTHKRRRMGRERLEVEDMERGNALEQKRAMRKTNDEITVHSLNRRGSMEIKTERSARIRWKKRRKKRMHRRKEENGENGTKQEKEEGNAREERGKIL